MSCDRRAFVRTTALAAASLALPACATMAAVRLPRTDGAVRLMLADHPNLARAGGMLRLMPDGFTTPVYVVALDDRFIALSSVCQHLGCTVNAQGDRFVCPCHGSMYGRDGSVLRGPTDKPLVQFPITRSADVLTIQVGNNG